MVGTEELREAGVGLAVRDKVESSIADRPFEPLQVDVTIATPDPWDAQPARRVGLLADLGLGPIEVLLVPRERHIAEKLHAYTRTYKRGGTTRARDLVDLLLIGRYERVEGSALAQAIQRVFARRATHAIPQRLPPPPRELAVSYRREADQIGLDRTVDKAHEILADWLNPMLDGTLPTDKIGPSSADEDVSERWQRPRHGVTGRVVSSLRSRVVSSRSAVCHSRAPVAHRIDEREQFVENGVRRRGPRHGLM